MINFVKYRIVLNRYNRFDCEKWRIWFPTWRILPDASNFENKMKAEMYLESKKVTLKALLVRFAIFHKHIPEQINVLTIGSYDVEIYKCKECGRYSITGGELDEWMEEGKLYSKLNEKT